jgi:hypothetical protein
VASRTCPLEFVPLERLMASSGLRPASPCQRDLARAKLRAMVVAPSRSAVSRRPDRGPFCIVGRYRLPGSRGSLPAPPRRRPSAWLYVIKFLGPGS